MSDSTPATISIVDLTEAARARAASGVALLLGLACAGWAWLLFPMSPNVLAPAAVTITLAGLLLASTTRQRIACATGSFVLMLLVMIAIALEAHGSLPQLLQFASWAPIGRKPRDWFSSGESSMALALGGIFLGGGLVLLGLSWGLLLDAYPRMLRSLTQVALGVERERSIRFRRWTAWPLVPIVSAPFLFLLSFLLHIVVRPFGGPTANRISLVQFAPLGWLASMRRLAKRKGQLPLQEALQRDTRPPILLLRSFADDGAVFNSLELKSRSYSGAVMAAYPFEEAIAVELCRSGPPIAIGIPGESLPSLGAYRAQYSDAEWQPAVLSWMDQAQLVVLFASTTKWLNWELQQIKNRNHLAKCVIYFPPVDVEAYRRLHGTVIEALADLPLSKALSAMKDARALALDFRNDPRIIAYVDDNCGRDGFALVTQAVIGRWQPPA